MAHFVGLDVSVKETAVCVVDEAGEVVSERKVPTEPDDIVTLLSSIGDICRSRITSAMWHIAMRWWSRPQHQTRPPLQADLFVASALTGVIGIGVAGAVTPIGASPGGAGRERGLSHRSLSVQGD